MLPPTQVSNAPSAPRAKKAVKAVAANAVAAAVASALKAAKAKANAHPAASSDLSRATTQPLTVHQATVQAMQAQPLAS
jgi:hypothetical protein